MDLQTEWNTEYNSKLRPRNENVADKVLTVEDVEDFGQFKDKISFLWTKKNCYNNWFHHSGVKIEILIMKSLMF